MSETRILESEEDMQLECDLAHNRYLQSLMAKQIMYKIMETRRANIKEELEQNQNIIEKLKTKKERNEQLEQSFKLKIKISKKIKDLEEILKKCESIIEEYNFIEKLNASYNSLEAASNKLYFQNVKMFENQVECNKFMETLDKTCKQIQASDTANTNVMKELADNITEYLVVSTDVMEKEEDITVVSNRIAPLFLENFADTCAAFNGDDEYCDQF